MEKIVLSNVGGISDIGIEFTSGLNIICGENGIGKSTILKSVAQVFFPYRAVITRRSSAESGKLAGSYNFNNVSFQFSYDISKFFPLGDDQLVYSFDMREMLKSVIFIQPDRDFNYTQLNAIERNPSRGVWDVQNVTFEKYRFDVLKQWFVNRSLFSGLDNSLEHHQIENLTTAKNAIGLLDPSTKFFSIDAKTFDITLLSKGEKIYLEYLSSGYKSCVFLIWQIIAEIEFRFSEDKVPAKDFSGIILIDELDVHLHPIWQSRIANAVAKTFPKSQIIITTHSPHVLQTAEANSVVALQTNSSNEQFVKHFKLGEFGFMGWSVEEILKDVMGLKDSISPVLDSRLKAIDNAIEEDDGDAAREAYEQLDDMLHPSSPLRKIYKLQLAGLGVEVHDKANPQT
ncbi:AAA family ATPase [Deinococcus terrestris]|nr:AAA family ATPase [Deinococcus terrestris]